MSFPKGLYDLLISNEVEAELQQLDGCFDVERRVLKGVDRRRRLIADLSNRLANFLQQHEAEEDYCHIEIQKINQILADIKCEDALWEHPVEALFSVHDSNIEVFPPKVGLHQPWLFAAGKSDISLLSELRAELSSADHVDILISFIRWEGVRRLMDLFKSATATDANGNARTKFRIITSTYMGATEERAVTWLASLPGTSVKVSLDGRRTRLHAKAWIFRRQSKFGSVYVGSANLSGAALTGGLEWTVKATESGQRDVYEKSVAHFETLWADPEFQEYDPKNQEHVDGLRQALYREGNRVTSPAETGIATTTWFDIEAKPFQKVILDRLHNERLSGRYRNLVISATGTGKTVIAALDYRRICQEEGGRPRLLFVAHRQEILQQAIETYRQVLREHDFGEVLYAGNEPRSKEHLFATIHSVLSRGIVKNLGSDFWRVVVIDECHHMAATSFKAFSEAIKPCYLLGLTATPERGDGVSIVSFFDSRPDGSPAAELRLWDALDQQLLAPLEYYGISDPTDFTTVPWGRSSAEKEAVNLIVLKDERRVRLVAHAVENYVSDINEMRALGFCVSVEHAKMMATSFSSQGIASLVAHGEMADEDRRSIRNKLEAGEIKVIFSCDLYNEGIDLPYVNTVLLLRPTDSPVVFAQQIGRGLRLWPNKNSCLILDFIGQYGNEFRFERLWRSVAGISKRELVEAVDKGFSSLPSGCVIQFDQYSKERVLANLRASTNRRWIQLANELKSYALMNMQKISFIQFIRDQCVDIRDIYRSATPSGWSALCVAAGIQQFPIDTEYEQITKRIFSILHNNDPGYLNFLKVTLGAEGNRTEVDSRRLRMLAYQLYTSGVVNGSELENLLVERSYILDEIKMVAQMLLDSSDISGEVIDGIPEEWPLYLHARYSRTEILAAVGKHTDETRAQSREGLLRFAEQKIELMFVTLDKSVGFHDDISYRDYAISPSKFHWETQNSTRPGSVIGRQYLESPRNGWRYFLFVRRGPDDPYFALGQAIQEQISGASPMAIIWRLTQPMTIELFQKL
jgi:superfamily II DNA or RNA helicase/HKD family nuclease